jgi:hypothetical protein
MDALRLAQIGVSAPLTPPPLPVPPPPPPGVIGLDRFVRSQPFSVGLPGLSPAAPSGPVGGAYVEAPALLPGVWPNMTPAHITPSATPGGTHTITLSPAESGKAFNIYPAIPDMKGFVAWFGSFDKPEVLGPTEYVPAPGTKITRDRASAPAPVRALQVSLARLGYGVQPNGTFDQATMAAVVNFRRANGFHEPFRDPTGAFAVLPFADQNTRMAILIKAGG